MATKPQIKTLTSTSVDVLNTIRKYATQNYKDYIPQATADAESIREIGNVMMDMPALQNEFLSALVNRIGMVLITSKMYSNPWSMFKRGMMEMGETVEEIFVNIAKPFQFDPEEAENTLFKREIPDVRSAFHVMNYKKFYKSTISNDQLRTAFLSWQGVTDLIAKIVDAMYTGANYDEFQVMKYMLAKRIMNGMLYPVTIPPVEKANMEEIVSTVKAVSNNMEFLSPTYNLAGVQNSASKSEQYIIVNSTFDAKMDVQVLASAFNMDKAEFMGKKVLVDGFGKLDKVRLAVLFKDDPSYTDIPDATLQAIDTIPAVLVDDNFFMIFDNLNNFTEQYNSQGLYWNYFYHQWKTFSISPFANNAVFVTGTPTVTSVTVSPDTLTLTQGQSIQLSATVVTSNFAPQTVNWSTDTEGVIVTPQGKVTVPVGVTGEVVVTATSVYDATKTGTATITVS